MTKAGTRRFRCLVLLACWLVCIPIKAEAQEDSTRPLTTVESRRQALSELTAERARLWETGNLVELVKVINRIGEEHLKVSDLDAASADAQESLSLARSFERTENENLLVDTLIFNARVHLNRQENDKAEEVLGEALDLSRDLRYRSGEAQSLTQLGLAYLKKPDYPKAEKTNNDALKIWREIGDKRGEALTLRNQGENHMLLDQPEPAAAALKSAETIWRELGDSTELATVLLDLNFLAIRQGQWQTALGLLSEAQSLITDKEAEPFLMGQIAMSFGEAYEAYGQLHTALSYFKEALGHYRDGAREKRATIDASNKVGRVQARLGDYAAATEQIQQGLKLAREIRAELLTGLCHEDLGKVWLAVDSPEQARQEFRVAIALFKKNGLRRPLARAQTFLGQAEYQLGNQASAAQAYQQALRFFEEVHDYTNEAALSFGLGKLALERKNLDEAGVYLERSINLTEQLRENAASKELRTSFLASVHDRYQTYVEWLMARHALQPEKGFDVLAFEASEFSRARSLLDSVKDHQRELRQAANPALLIEEEKLQKQEQGLLDRKARLISEGAPEQERAEVESELVDVRTRHEALQAQINSSTRFANLLRPVPLKFAAIQTQVTDGETALLEYSLGNQKSYLWLVTADGMQPYELADKQTIENVARKAVHLLSKQKDDPNYAPALREATAELSRLIIDPVADKLNASRLLIVADGILQYVPFQMLIGSSRGDEPLVARHEIVNIPSASTLAILRQESANRPVGAKLVAAFGDPVVPSSSEQVATVRSNESEDETNSEAFDPNKLGPLFFAKAELNQLRDLGPQNDSVIYSDYNATRDSLRRLDLREYRILHFATHGFFNAQQPELSGLVLSLVDPSGKRIDGFVGLSDIYKLNAPVDLVVLSACQSALGQDVRGEGLIGLTRGFMYAGASSVVASLWKVDDEATAELMKHFYTNMLQRGMTPAAALREAQNRIREQPQWKSPFYWAAFTLQGEYRRPIQPAPRHAWPAQPLLYSIGAVGLLAIALWWYFRSRARLAQRAK